jgi:predicted component of type VI protein secretion system
VLGDIPARSQRVAVEIAMNYRFVLVDNATGSNQAHWVLPLPAIVGRCPTADITINDSSISRRHCQFSLNSEGALVVRDLESLNGIYIDQQRVHKAVVPAGTVVQIGSITLRPEWTEDEVVESPEMEKIYDVDATQPMRIFRPTGENENFAKDGES